MVAKIDSSMANAYELEHNHNSNSSITPVALRAPQLNSKVPGHGGSSQDWQDIGESGDNNSESDIYFISYDSQLHQDAYLDDDDTSDDGAELVFGQEGVEKNQVEDPGYRCSCHEPTRQLNPGLRQGDEGYRTALSSIIGGMGEVNLLKFSLIQSVKPDQREEEDHDSETEYEIDNLTDSEPKVRIEKKKPIITHSEENKHQCSFPNCGNSYSRAEHLSRHQLMRM